MAKNLVGKYKKMKPEAFEEIFVLVPRATTPVDPFAGSARVIDILKMELLKK